MERFRDRTAVITGGMPLVARAREADHDARAFLRFDNRFARRSLTGTSLDDLRRGGATLMAWTGLAQWNGALLRLVSPGADSKEAMP